MKGMDMLKTTMAGLMMVCGLVVAGCNTEGVLVVSGVVAGLAGGLIEVGELILKMFGVV
jgi:hypothetical protein